MESCIESSGVESKQDIGMFETRDDEQSGMRMCVCAHQKGIHIEPFVHMHVLL